MTAGFEKSIEFIMGEEGPVITARPAFPIEAETFRVTDAGKLEILGGGKLMSFDLPDDICSGFKAAEQIELFEYPRSGMTPVRELIVLRHSD